MIIVPAINCADFDCVKEKLRKAAEFFSPTNGWAQIDIADGKFTNWKTWNNPEEISNLKSQISNLNLEIHLMIEEPQNIIDDWIKAGAKRIIVHLETVENFPPEADSFLAEKLKTENLKHCEIGLAINPDTSAKKLVPYLNQIKFVQILAVDPGLSGQKFQLQVLDKIKFLKSNYPDAIIEIDGGINLETAKLCKEAGADILVSGSYIWSSSNPKEAFKKLFEL